MTNARPTKTFQEIQQFEVSVDRQLVRQGGGSQCNLRLQLTAGAAPLGKERPPVRVGFAVDRSGSMGGGKLELAALAVMLSMPIWQATVAVNGAPLLMVITLAAFLIWQKLDEAADRDDPARTTDRCAGVPRRPA